MIYLKEATAGQVVPLGPFLDDADGNTEEVGLTINAADILIWKDGATTLAAKNSGGATHIQNGVYYATLDATDTNTVGPLSIFVHVAGALFFRLACVVLPAQVYDSLIAGSDYLDTNAVQWAGVAVTAGNEAASVVGVVSAGNITVYRGTTWTISLTGIGVLTAYDKVYFTVKSQPSETDSQALLQAYNAAAGLLVFNGATPAADTDGTVTIDDAGAGDITVTVQPGVTAAAPPGTYRYDVKGVDLDGSVVELSAGGKFVVLSDITRATT